MALGRAQVGEWLRSMNLERYMQSFLDNGYDDMCVCRQIGDPDLDAIGVEDEHDRRTVLDAIRILLENDSSATGSGPVYYTLENPEYDEPPPLSEDSEEPPSPPPRIYHTPRKNTDPGIVPLAEEYKGSEVKQNVTSVFPIKVAKGQEEPSTLSTGGRSHGDGVVSSNSYHGSPSQHLGGIKSGEGFPEEKLYLSGGVSLEALNTTRSGDFMGAMSQSHKIPTLSKLFKLKHGKSQKYSYKPHEGDLNASEITMSDSQCIKLMLQVKQGQLSQEDAIKQVKLYEEHKRFCTPQGDITPSHSFEGTFNIKESDIKSQKCHHKHDLPAKLKSKLLPLFLPHCGKPTVTAGHPDAQKLSSAPSSCDAGHYSDEQPRRGSLPTQCLSPPQDVTTETSSGDFDEWPDKKAPFYKKLYPPEEFELSAGYKDSRLLKQQSLRRCQEDNIDLNSDGMSQGESERTASSSLESVHSYSGVPSLSSSSSQGSVTLDDPNIFRQQACLARVLVDYVPSPYDNDALKLKKGDIIQVLKKDITGIWLGKIDNRIGNFKFINVELLSEEPSSPGVQDVGLGLHSLMQQSYWSHREGQSMVEALLNSLSLQHLISVFVLNGYVTLNDIKGLTEKDLDELNVWKPEDRSKVMAAVELVRSGQVLFREKADKKHFSQLASGEATSRQDSSGSVRSDILRRHHESKIPSPVIRKGHTLGGHKISHKEQHHPKDSGFEGQYTSITADDKETEPWVKSSTSWSSTTDTHHQSTYTRHDQVSRQPADCDNFSADMYRYRTYSDGRRTKNSETSGHGYSVQSKEAQSRIPRNRTNSLDQSLKRPPKKSPQSWHHNLTSVVDSAYSSAPNTPILQRNGGKDRAVRLQSELTMHDASLAQGSNLAAMYPHLAGVKTAHIRSLSQSVSRSAPVSPAAIPRITPAARSSIHAHPRAGKPPRLRQKGIESVHTESRLAQGKKPSRSAKSDSQRHQDTATTASILKVLGLSQYESVFKSHGIITRQHFLDLKEKDLQNMGIKSVDHLQRLLLWQRHRELEGMRSHDSESGSKGQRLSNLRDKV